MYYFMPDTIKFVEKAKARNIRTTEAKFISIPSFLESYGRRQYLGNIYWYFVKIEVNEYGIHPIIYLNDLSDFSGGGKARLTSLLEWLAENKVKPMFAGTIPEKISIIAQMCAQEGKFIDMFKLVSPLPFTEMGVLAYPNMEKDLVIRSGYEYYIWRDPPEQEIIKWKRYSDAGVVVFYGEFRVEFNILDALIEAFKNYAGYPYHWL